MRPIDFVLYNGGSEPNKPIHCNAGAMQRPIQILADDGEYEVLSYYMDDRGRMCLDIQKKRKSKK